MEKRSDASNVTQCPMRFTCNVLTNLSFEQRFPCTLCTKTDRHKRDLTLHMEGAVFRALSASFKIKPRKCMDGYELSTLQRYLKRNKPNRSRKVEAKSVSSRAQVLRQQTPSHPVHW